MQRGKERQHGTGLAKRRQEPAQRGPHMQLRPEGKGEMARLTLTVGVSGEPHGRVARAGQPGVSGQVGRGVSRPATRARQRGAPSHHEVGVQAISSTAGGVQAGQVGQLLALSGREQRYQRLPRWPLRMSAREGVSPQVTDGQPGHHGDNTPNTRKSQLRLQRGGPPGPSPQWGPRSLEKGCGTTWPRIRITGQDSGQGAMPMEGHPPHHKAPRPSPEQFLLVPVQPRTQQPLLPVPGPLIPTFLICSAVP